MTKEVWKNIEGYEELYQVSNFGRVKSLNYKRSGKERILKQQPNNNGYLIVGLCKNNICKKFLVHRLVAQMFIPNNQNLFYVNHKDENPKNNHVDNLEFCSHEYNMNYGTILERKRESMKGKHHYHTEETKRKMSKPILQYTKDGVFIREWIGINTASRELNIDNGDICRCCKGQQKSAGNYIWKYKSI